MVSTLHHVQNKGKCFSLVSGKTLTFVGLPQTGHTMYPLSFDCIQYPPMQNEVCRIFTGADSEGSAPTHLPWPINQKGKKWGEMGKWRRWQDSNLPPAEWFAPLPAVSQGKGEKPLRDPFVSTVLPNRTTSAYFECLLFFRGKVLTNPPALFSATPLPHQIKGDFPVPNQVLLIVYINILYSLI